MKLDRELEHDVLDVGARIERFLNAPKVVDRPGWDEFRPAHPSLRHDR
jgi:hypothetical protein